MEVQYLLHNPSQPNLTYIIGTNFDELKDLRHVRNYSSIIVRLRKLSLKLLNNALSTGALLEGNI